MNRKLLLLCLGLISLFFIVNVQFSQAATPVKGEKINLNIHEGGDEYRSLNQGTIKEFMEKEVISEGEIPRLHLTVYGDDVTVNKFEEDYEEVKSYYQYLEEDWVLIFLVAHDGFRATISSDKISEDELETLISRSYNQLRRSQDYSQEKFVRLVTKGIIYVSATDLGVEEALNRLQSINVKDMNKYSDKQAFLVSDRNWRRALSLVPVTTWTQQEEAVQGCQRGYQTAAGVCTYPHLIYHQEGSSAYDPNFDADSALYFLQQYRPDSLRLVGGSPRELDNLLRVEPELGAGLELNQITRISKNNYLNYWESYQDVVYVEDNYEKALIAATYASLINSPLLIENYNDGVNLEDKNVVCVGDVATNCDERYSQRELEEKYVEKTNTARFILTNPEDLTIAVKERFIPERSSKPITNLYSKTSLAAPLLASAKHEVILTSPSADSWQVYQTLEARIKELLNLPQSEPAVDITSSLQAKTLNYFTEKNEQGLTVTFELLKDYESYQGKELLIQNIYEDRDCLKANITLETEKGRLEESPTTSQLVTDIHYIKPTLKVPPDLLPLKGRFNITFKGDCEKLLVLEGHNPRIEDWSVSATNSKKMAEAVKIYNKENKREIVTGLGAGNSVGRYTDINQDFSYNFSLYPDQASILQTDKRIKGNRVGIDVSNPEDHFVYVDRLRLAPKLKRKAKLTVLASPKAIQLSQKKMSWGSYVFRTALDHNLYANLYNNRFIDLGAGRLMGITPSDVSSYIARDLVYDQLPQEKDGLIILKSSNPSYDANKLRRGFGGIWTRELKNKFNSYTECYSYNDPKWGCDTHSSTMRSKYTSSEAIFFDNHGSTKGLPGIINTEQLSTLSPSIQIADACLTCSFAAARSKQDLFCVNNIRKGSLGFIGAASVSQGITSSLGDRRITAETSRRLLTKIFLEGQDLGSAFNQVYPQESGTFGVYFLLGDPTFEVRS